MRRHAVTGLLCATVLAGAPARTAQAPGQPPAPGGAGIGVARTPGSLSEAVARRAAIGALRCARRAQPVALAHVEIFARGHVVVVPPGIGLAPPRRRAGAYVRAGACRYAASTTEPTGLIHLTRRDLRLGDLFAIWGRPLGRTRLAAWRAPVVAHVDGRRWRGDPRAIPLHPHAQIVLQAGGPLLVPHARYRFPPTR